MEVRGGAEAGLGALVESGRAPDADVPEPTSVTQKDNPRLAELRAMISARLRGVCSAMPQPEFDALVARAAEIEYKYEVGDPGRSPFHLPLAQQNLTGDKSES